MIFIFYFDFTKQSALFGVQRFHKYHRMYVSSNLINKIQTSKSIDFGDLFNESLGVFKKVWVQGLLLQLFSIIIMLPLLISFYLPYFTLALSMVIESNWAPESSALVEEYGAS